MRKLYKLFFALGMSWVVHGEICLVVVVNNDEALIEHSLESVKDLVDCVCIYNQGCTDDTLVLVDSFKRETGLPVLIVYPEEDAESALTAAFYAAQTLLKSRKCALEKSYCLFLQAGSVCHYTASLQSKLVDLNADSYSCRNMYPFLNLGAYRPFLLKASLNWEETGHFLPEWSAQGAVSSEPLDAFSICQSEHFFTQSKLQDWIESWKSTDDKFFLAQAYAAKEEYQQAIALHKAFIEKEQSPDAVWLSYFMIGHCYEKLENWDEALHWYLETYQYNPSRAEPLLRCATHYREQADNELAYLFAKQGARIGNGTLPSLFPLPLLQNYQFDEELSIAAYYTQYRLEGNAAANDLLIQKNVPWSLKELTYRNLLFYVSKLSPLRTMPIDFSLPPIVAGGNEHYHPMNPSIRKTAKGYQVICRSVNYLQTGAKTFSTTDPTGVFRTRNFLLDYDRFFSLQDEKEIIENLPRTRIRSFNLEGLDDCRIFSLHDELWFSCNTGDTNPCGTFQISLCKLAEKTDAPVIYVEKLIPLKGPDPHRCEKNWLPFIHEGTLSFIYSYAPFLLYTPELKSGNCATALSYESGYDFSHFRGSAAPIPFDDGYLMLVHEVVLQEDYSRCYLHRFLFLDKSLRITKLSKPFFFDHRGVEYCCSMTLDHSGQQLIIPIGLEDREAHLYFYDCNQIRSLLHSLKENNSHVFSS